MHIVHQTPAVGVTDRSSRDIDADLLIFPVLDDAAAPPEEPDLDRASDGEVAAARARGEFKGKPYDLFITTVRGWKSPHVALVGLGPRKEFTPDRLRRAAIAAALAARQRGLARIAFVYRPEARARDTADSGTIDAAQLLAEGAVLANFDGASYKTTSDSRRVWIKSVTLRLAGESGAVAQGVERGRVLGECTNVARALANEPANTLTPREFADRAVALAKEAGLTVDVLDEKRIAELRMGLLLGVARGSQEPPRVVVLRHEPAKVTGGPVLGLIGKGITFDTGGISIKPADNMDRMKDDMSGGAAVLSAMTAIARLQVPVRCIGVIPMTENMPGGRAIKPGDVLVSAEGKTVEVLNTDAEGRLILGDALWYARRLGATHLVDVATLTGACVVALGRTASGLFGTPDWWREEVRRASERAGDRSWPMPLFDDYKELFKSEIADFANTGGRAGGAITGALFIKEFSGDLPWVHMDIAGPAWAEDATPYQPKGSTGVGVRTLAELALAADRWGKLEGER
jgi:leucyl aminopeptidase